MKKHKVTINRELLCRVYHDTIVEAEGEDEAWEKAEMLPVDFNWESESASVSDMEQ